MLKPIINLVISKNEAHGGYQKTILFDTNTISLKLEDTTKIKDANKACFTYDILEPINMDSFKDLEYVKEDMLYHTDIYVPIFKEEDEKRQQYLMGEAPQSIEYTKFPVINEKDRYKVVEIYCETIAGTDDIGDVISIDIGFFNGFTQSETVEDLLDDEEARNKIPTVIVRKDLEDIIYNINVARNQEELPIAEYRYHTLDGKSVLLDMNLTELIESNMERGSSSETIDISFFDMISTMMNAEIIYNKNILLKSGIQILMSQEQLKRLMEFDFSKKTWDGYIKKGFFKVI